MIPVADLVQLMRLSSTAKVRKELERINTDEPEFYDALVDLFHRTERSSQEEGWR